MTSRGTPFKMAVLLSISGLALAVDTRGLIIHHSTSDALPLFILVSGVGGVLFSLMGAIQRRGRSPSLHVTLGLAVYVLASALQDS